MSRAPKQWILGKKASISDFEAWKNNLVYTISLDPNFAPYLLEGSSWLKYNKATPLRGLVGDDAGSPNAKTGEQKLTHLEQMLGQVANYCPVISRNALIKNSTSIKSVWNIIRTHYGFQKCGGQILNLSDITMVSDDSYEDLYQKLNSFIDDNLLKSDDTLKHHEENINEDEEVSPTLENLLTVLWLQLIHPKLPKLVLQKYGTDLKKNTLASIRIEISSSLTSLLAELESMDGNAQVLKTLHRGRNQLNFNSRPSGNAGSSFGKIFCPLCKEAKRPYNHFLSKCQFLPDSDKKYFSRVRSIYGFEQNMSDDSDQLFNADYVSTSMGASNSTLFEDPNDLTNLCLNENDVNLGIPSVHKVNVQHSPFFDVNYNNQVMRLILDTGSETSMIRAGLAHHLGMKFGPSTQRAVQADGKTPLRVVAETHVSVYRDGLTLHLDALIVENLDVDVIAGTPFIRKNDISIRLARNQICIGSHTITYNPNDPHKRSDPSIRFTQVQPLRAPQVRSTLWPGDTIELDIPTSIQGFDSYAIVPRPLAGSSDKLWPTPEIVQCTSTTNKVTVVNNLDLPINLNRNEHCANISLTTDKYVSDVAYPELTPKNQVNNAKQIPNIFSNTVTIDPDNQLQPPIKSKFSSLIGKYDNVFSPVLRGYNGAFGPIKAVVNIGPVQPPQRKGRLPLYGKNRLVELQQKFDELEEMGVFKKPEDLGITVEYLNASFLVNKPSGGTRLVTAFTDVAKYSKPQPSLLPDVDSTLRIIGSWKFICETDLTKAYHQLPLSNSSLKYCGVATPYRGIRVYVRSAMGMPGSETALEELMCRILGDELVSGSVAKIADNLYCGGETPEELYSVLERVLMKMDKANIQLSAPKTVICPKSSIILGWKWCEGTLSPTSHRISTLSTCAQPTNIKGLRSFLGAYKMLGRVIRNHTKFLDPLEAECGGKESKHPISWSDELHKAFKDAQSYLKSWKAITIPKCGEQLIVVTDGSVRENGIGSTLYTMRNDKPVLAGFFSAKLRNHQVRWLPCEVEALGIAASVKHFSPYIIQSGKKTCVLTDNKPCVEAHNLLCKGEFSASPRVSTFLSVASRFQVTIQHLSGNSNVPSDFASRNAPPCPNPDQCQICQFVDNISSSVVRNTSTQDIINGITPLPFTTRSTWIQAQTECPDLRRTLAHLSQGTRPSKKETSIPDVKRYLNVASVSRDRLLVVPLDDPLSPKRDRIIVPRQAISGLLSALHIKLDHPTAYQMKRLTRRYFFALDMDKYIEQVSNSCHLCTSLKTFPKQQADQSTSNPPEAVGISFSADVLRRCKQIILVIRETATSYTSTRFIPNETAEALREGLALQCLELHTVGAQPCVVKVDPAPGFQALRNDTRLKQLGICLEIGDAKNANKNPVCDKAISELELVIRQQNIGERPLSSLQLAEVTARLNSRIRFTGLSAKEIWTQRDQFTGDPLPLDDRQILIQQHKNRLQNHISSEKSKSSIRPLPPSHLGIGDLVYLRVDGNKNSPRDRYIVVTIDKPYCQVRKFSGSQFRSSLYRVKLQDCYRVPCDLDLCKPPSLTAVDSDDDDEIGDDQYLNPPNIPIEITAPPDTSRSDERPTRERRMPSYLNDFVLNS